MKIKKLVMTKKALIAGLSLFIVYCLYNITSNYIVINKSNSLPGHVYLIKHDLNYEKDSLVLFCPDEKLTNLEEVLNNSVRSSRCKTGVNPLIKVVAATSYDDVIADGEHNLIINNKVIPNSKPSSKVPLPIWTFNGILPKDEVLVLTSNPESLDSRYYGPIQAEQILSTVKELF